MRLVYRERLEALNAAAERCCRGSFRLRPVRTGLHALADLDGVDAVRVVREAAARGVEVASASAYCAARTPALNAIQRAFARSARRSPPTCRPRGEHAAAPSKC
jgi:DNA-binding transcriptional MocR family regulator